MVADSLLRGVAGTSATLRLTGGNEQSTQSEMGLIPTVFGEVVLSPVVLRRLPPSRKSGDTNFWELLVSATSVLAQVRTLDVSSAQSLFGMALAVIVAGQEFLVESIASNEAFGQVYLYRLLLREAHTQPL